MSFAAFFQQMLGKASQISSTIRYVLMLSYHNPIPSSFLYSIVTGHGRAGRAKLLGYSRIFGAGDAAASGIHPISRCLGTRSDCLCFALWMFTL